MRSQIYSLTGSNRFKYCLDTELGKFYVSEKSLNQVSDSIRVCFTEEMIEDKEVCYDSNETRKGLNYHQCRMVVASFFSQSILGFTWECGRISVPETKRKYYEDLQEYLKADYKNYGCMLIGVRRTGKTVMMQQAHNELVAQGKKSIYVSILKEGVTGSDFCCYIEALKLFGFEYIFIDEISYLSQEMDWVLTEIEHAGSIKMIFTATDSLALKYVEAGSFYDRGKIIPMTYISFKEYANIYKGSSVIDYIQAGGLLENSSEYNKQHSIEFAKMYVNTAIVENFIGCVKRQELYGYFPHLSQLTEEQIRTVFYKWSEHYSIKMTLELLNTEITVSDLSQAIKNVKTIPRSKIVTFKKLIIDEFTKSLNLVEHTEYKQNEFDEARWILVNLGCLVEIADQRELLLPIAIKYGFTMELVENLQTVAREIADSLGIVIDTEKLAQNITEHVQGSLIEELVTYDMYRKGYKPYKLRIGGQAEVDIVDKYGNFYEVKRGNSIDIRQMRWLVNSSILKQMPQSLNLLTLDSDEKVVTVSEKEVLMAVYTGKEEYQEQIDFASDDKYEIQCKNVNKFLCEL